MGKHSSEKEAHSSQHPNTYKPKHAKEKNPGERTTIIAMVKSNNRLDRTNHIK
jgi:hypothetical protein